MSILRSLLHIDDVAKLQYKINPTVVSEPRLPIFRFSGVSLLSIDKPPQTSRLDQHEYFEVFKFIFICQRWFLELLGCVYVSGSSVLHVHT